MNPIGTTDAASPGDMIQEILQSLMSQLDGLLGSLLRPWVGYQLIMIAGLVGLAMLLSRLLQPRLHDWLREREGWPKWRIRMGLIVHRRLTMILFALMVWCVILVMREVTWPSRSYLLTIAGMLSAAWLFVAFATRVIVNQSLRHVVRYGAWAWVTLSILNLTDEAQALLDSLSFHIGETRISVWLLLQAVAILTVLITIARFLSTASAANIRRLEDINPSMQVLAIKAIQTLLFGTAFFLGLRLVGVDLTGLAVLSGAIGVGLGFGLQKVVSNLVSGVIILLDKSIKPGDVISLGDTFGWIDSLGARYVSVVTRDGKEYLIPNEDLITGQVVNWSHSDAYVRLDLFFGTAYGDDPHVVRRIAIEAAKSVKRVLGSERPPVCHIVGFGDSSVDYILRFWIEDPTEGLTNIKGNVYLALWDAFRAHGISIPFPQREVTVLGGTMPANRADLPD